MKNGRSVMAKWLKLMAATSREALTANTKSVGENGVCMAAASRRLAKLSGNLAMA